MEVSLVNLINYHHLILSQCPVLLDLSKQQPLSQKQQFGGCCLGGFKADLVPHLQYVDLILLSSIAAIDSKYAIYNQASK